MVSNCHCVALNSVIRQSSLLRYWNFVPADPALKESDKESTSSDRTRVQAEHKTSRMRVFSIFRSKKRHAKQTSGQDSLATARESRSENIGKAFEPPKKKMPVFFIDEAHKL